MIKATFDYRLSNPNARANYGLVPFFADTRGGGRLFNSHDDAIVIAPLTETSGQVALKYPIQHEWNDVKLARPIQIWFAIVEALPPPGDTRIITKIGPYNYR